MIYFIFILLVIKLLVVLYVLQLVISLIDSTKKAHISIVFQVATFILSSHVYMSHKCNLSCTYEVVRYVIIMR